MLSSSASLSAGTGEQGGDVGVAVRLCHVLRRVAVDVAWLGGSAAVKQECHHIFVSRSRGAYESGVTALVLSINVGTVVDQVLDHLVAAPTLHDGVGGKEDSTWQCGYQSVCRPVLCESFL